MTEQMKPGDAVLVRATYEDHQDDGTWAWVTIEEDRDMPGGDDLVRRSRLTTEAAIRADERRRVAEMLGNEAGRLRDRARGIYEGEQVDADAACDEIDRLDIEAETLERMRKRIEREGGAG